MAVRIESQAEPIPGYRLIERLGGGGFGEVWKCEAPGGLFKAIKFVYGDLESSDDEEGARAEQELKALSRVKTVHHPYILSLERFDIIDGQLLIVMELADRTLWDRFRECRTQGQMGIPRDEMISYMEETAEALDLMDSLYQLQHLDIKPQNLFLVHNHVKVADFGLVKDLEGGCASVTGGVTPVYAAPETFDGKVTRFSDQYSLAIVYQELITGQRPFTGNSLRQLVMQHLYNEPDLSPLSAADRPAVARALAKKPEDRYPTCKDFVRALHEAIQLAPAEGGAGPPEPEDFGAEGEKTEGRPVRRAAPTPVEVIRPPLNREAEHAAPAGGSERTTPPPARDLHRPAESAPAVAAVMSEPTTPVPGNPRKSATEIQAGGILTPALVIGLGQMGLYVLKQLRQELHEQFGGPEAVPPLRLLHLDTDPETSQAAARGPAETALRSSETLLARLQRPSHYIKPREGQGVQAWLHPKVLYRMPRQQVTSGIRALGRLAFVDNYRPIARRLEAELAACCRPEPLQQAGKQTRLGVRSGTPRVYVVAGLAGGTAGGMFLDVAYTVRQLLIDLGHEEAEIVGLFVLPSADAEAARPAELANTYAALTELNHFADPRRHFQARYESGEAGTTAQVVLSGSGPPFQRCVLFSLPDPRGAGPAGESPDGTPPLSQAAARVVGLAGRYLFTELATSLSRAADQARRQAASRPAPLYQAVGMYRQLWPRRQMLDRAARGLCRRLVQRWMSKDAKALREPLKPWVQKQWDDHSLGLQQIIARLQEGCERALKQTPEAAFTALVAAVQATLPPPGKPSGAQPPPLKMSLVLETMEQFEQLVGVPEECRNKGRPGPTSTPPPAALERALAEMAAALREEHDQKLAELVVRLIEDPQYRLAGAEEALRQMSEYAEGSLRTHEDLARELQQRAIASYKRIQELIDKPEPGAPGGGWKTPSTRRGAAASAALATELLELLRLYPKYRYQSLVLQRVNGLYVSLRGQLSDQLREVDFCRARLGELLGLFGGAEADRRAGAPTAGRCLLPQGCKTLDEAVAKIDEAVTAENLQELDRKTQLMLRKQFRALVQVCMTAGSVLRTLAPAMLEEARGFLGPRLAATDVAETYLEQHGAAESADGTATDVLRQDLLTAYNKAAPELRGTFSAAEIFVLSVPPGHGGQEFRDLTRQALGVPRVVDALGADEIIFYREYQGLSLGELEQAGPAAREAYRKLLAQEALSPHSRVDITDWQPAGA